MASLWIYVLTHPGSLYKDLRAVLSLRLGWAEDATLMCSGNACSLCSRKFYCPWLLLCLAFIAFKSNRHKITTEQRHWFQSFPISQHRFSWNESHGRRQFSTETNLLLLLPVDRISYRWNSRASRLLRRQFQLDETDPDSPLLPESET